MAKIIITAIVLLVVFAGLIVILDNVKVSQTTPTPTAEVSASATPVTDFGTTGNIRVSSPKADDEIGLPLVIKGEARTFEAAFSYRIKNGKGTVLVEGHGMTTGTADYPEFRPFEVSVNYPDPKTASGSVEVFEYSAKDGSEINKVIVPVRFKKVDAIEVKLYLDLNTPITTRIPKTETPVRATLDELLVRMGNTDTRIISVDLKAGVLTVNIDGLLDATAIAQITKTAMQFSSVKSVVVR